MKDENYGSLVILPVFLTALYLQQFYSEISGPMKLLSGTILLLVALVSACLYGFYLSSWARERRKRLRNIADIPIELRSPVVPGVLMGTDINLNTTVYLPDDIRKRHVHILGATGSGKTESVILNFLRQDVSRDLGSIILDAKGDHSFLHALKSCVPKEKLLVFDLSAADSLEYDPLFDGSPLESAQRLFSSLMWSEEYYKNKALSVLQKLFQTHYEMHNRNPRLNDLATYLDDHESYSKCFAGKLSAALALKEFQEISGLRDQVRSLTLAHLAQTLSPVNQGPIVLSKAQNGSVIYFRLQSLLSPQLVSALGKLVINHLNFLAGTAHREQVEVDAKERKLVPVYVDEFASFACTEFADLISKARSAGFALHFSHQSIGDVTDVSPGFLGRITDNSATKIILRINDPDSAEFFARSFGTKEIQKTTQRITNTKEIDLAEVVGEGTARDAHQFRASPDLLKTLPTGTGAVLIAHGRRTPHGASSVFTISFPLFLHSSAAH